MLRFVCVAVFMLAGVRCHRPVVDVYLHPGTCEYHPCHAAYVDIRHTVEVGHLVVAQLHEAVAADLQVGIVSHLEDLLRERPEQGLLHRMEPFLTGIGALLHAGLVEHRVLFLHSLVQGQQAHDVAPPQLGGDTVVADAHGILNERLLRGLSRVAGQHRETVVVAHVLQGLVQARLMSVGSDDGGFQVVRHHDGRDTSEVLQTHAEGEEEVLRTLRRNAVHEDVAAEGHAGDEHLRLDDLPCIGVDIRKLVTRKVHHQLLASLVDHGKHGGGVLLRHEVLLQVFVELRLPIAVGMRLAVLLPQQLSGDMQLAVG